MIKVVKEGLIDDSRQGGPNAARPHALLHNYDMAGLAHALRDGLHVEGLQADQIDHLQPATTALSLCVQTVRDERPINACLSLPPWALCHPCVIQSMLHSNSLRWCLEGMQVGTKETPA